LLLLHAHAATTRRQTLAARRQSAVRQSVTQQSVQAVRKLLSAIRLVMAAIALQLIAARLSNGSDTELKRLRYCSSGCNIFFYIFA
jgi:hypothetical protein